ncbi:MAG TPA: gluconate 2-dehydrogenase subunit 3 family protein [Xanthobacteraceae bacterium]|nr:gluconate 2-dehydrogenase subunit 3 family protein [Xanthobacteraceae bacterium]
MTNDSSFTSRRHFLRWSAAVTPALVARSVAAAPGPQEPQSEYHPSFFNADEWTFLRAAVARLIPADAHGPGALEADVPRYIDLQMATPWAEGRLWYMQGPFEPNAPPTMGWQMSLTPRDVYRLGIASADSWTRGQHGKPFAELDPATQDDALRAFESSKARFDKLPAHTFFAVLLENTREGFFSDPVHGGNRGLVGWKLIGFPGARGDFMDWVERDVTYPLPPVALNGQRS